MINKVFRFIGTLLYWASWPVLTTFINGSRRTRLLLSSGDQVLVVQGWLSDGRWGLPGGGIKKGEDPLVGVVRETKEETNLVIDPKIIRFIGEQPIRQNGFHYECHYFAAKLATPEQTKAHSEVMRTKWIDRRQLNKKNSSNDVLAALKLVGES